MTEIGDKAFRRSNNSGVDIGGREDLIFHHQSDIPRAAI
jgi:hypothetical protein